MNTKYQSKHNHLLHNYYLCATCFDSLESSSGPTKNRSKVIQVYRALWDPKSLYNKWLCIDWYFVFISIRQTHRDDKH